MSEGNEHIENMGRDLLDQAYQEDADDLFKKEAQIAIDADEAEEEAAYYESMAEQRRAMAINTATSLNPASLAELLSAAGAVERYLRGDDVPVGEIPG